ncbi:hypothetical protein HPP92_010121 [Vanilla planifolia]|uniref:Glucan endo-1,3-beta-D-glucosidase n=1 Tax=Vanilla planifolia TaxID=51239 RepID=A0A835QWK6_VANPL|nr:hypothetical protein HPP92_010121 [Vanilla planifolia]
MVSTVLLFLHLLTTASAAASGGGDAPYVGVVIGEDVSGLFSPAELVRFLFSQRITHLRLSNPKPSLLEALNGTGISVLLGIPNSLLLAFASSTAAASAWASRVVLPFHPSSVPISAVAVGDDFSPSSSNSVLLPAIRSLSSALSPIRPKIPISTPLPFSIILNPFPPSQAFFNQSLTPNFILPLLDFLSSNNFPLMLNLYPYYSFMRSRGVIPLDSALFKPLSPSKEEVDPNTLLHYTNLFDAMVDAAHCALRSLNFSQIPLLVTETGWPSVGDPKTEPFATRDNADTYNSNLIKHVVVDRAGTPLVPEHTPSVYIYELLMRTRNRDQNRRGIGAFLWKWHAREGKVVGSCYFQGVAMVTTTDPSHDECIFPGSSCDSLPFTSLKTLRYIIKESKLIETSIVARQLDLGCGSL